MASNWLPKWWNSRVSIHSGFHNHATVEWMFLNWIQHSRNDLSIALLRFYLVRCMQHSLLLNNEWIENKWKTGDVDDIQLHSTRFNYIESWWESLSWKKGWFTWALCRAFIRLPRFSFLLPFFCFFLPLLRHFFIVCFAFCTMAPGFIIKFINARIELWLDFVYFIHTSQHLVSVNLC